MISPSQETNNINVQTNFSAVIKCNNGVQVEPLNPISNTCSNTNEQILRDDHQQATPVQFSVLRHSLRPIMLKFEDVAYSITIQGNENGCFSSTKPKATRKILNGVSGIVRPGELLAMLGPSGSGKTTLLTALGGRLQGKISGSILYNGKPFSSSMKRKTGFVSQDDVFYPHLTVLETLTYAAFLRLPNTLSSTDKIQQAELIIKQLGLTMCRNSMVGNTVIRGVSGGERKRVSIGQEMLVNPSLLLLDEPTSGLDSTTAQHIVSTLRWLAKGGRTVVTTIHQPSSRLFRMFDKVLVLSEGFPIYCGFTNHVMEYFGSIGYVPGCNLVNPADFLLDLANGVSPDIRQDDQFDFILGQDNHDDKTVTQYLISSYKRISYPVLKDEIRKRIRFSVPPDQFSTARSCDDRWTASWWLQFKVLLSRGLKERKHESYSGLKICQVMSVAILSGLLWWHSGIAHIQDQVGLLFFFSIFWGFFPLFNATFSFPQDRPMLTKEQSSGMYSLSSYYFARMVGDLPMELVFPTIFITITYWMGGLKPSLTIFALNLLIILLNVLVSQGLGLALGAILMDVKQATTLCSVTMLVFLLASGYYIQHIPHFIDWLKYVSFSHYCYKLLVTVQYSNDELYECGTGPSGGTIYCRVYDNPSVKYLVDDTTSRDVMILVIMLVGFRVLAYIALRVRQGH